jgi:hypothetical protein
MKTWLIRGVTIILVLLTSYVVLVFWIHYHYDKPDYSFGVKNGSDEVFRNGTFRVLPKGFSPFGILDPGQAKYHADPPWPLPEKFLLSFEDPEGRKHKLEVASGLKKGFKGRITVVLKKNENGCYAEVETSPLDE